MHCVAHESWEKLLEKVFCIQKSLGKPPSLNPSGRVGWVPGSEGAYDSLSNLVLPKYVYLQNLKKKIIISILLATFLTSIEDLFCFPCLYPCLLLSMMPPGFETSMWLRWNWSLRCAYDPELANHSLYPTPWPHPLVDRRAHAQI